MATPRDIRRMAFSALYQLDAHDRPDEAQVRASLDEVRQGHDSAIDEKDREKAMALARAAFETRGEADREVMELSPGWPAHRQPAVDRAIIRLAWYELTSGRTSPKIAVNEAVELAKEFSTEKSPAFVNGVLDKVLKRVLASVAAPEPPAELAPDPSVEKT
ncbi:MAG: transcription antitermination factor NusB [Planctomycetes bacterium]|nr:transcription antitermination factor NusB [Planctomycetota bacterium]